MEGVDGGGRPAGELPERHRLAGLTPGSSEDCAQDTFVRAYRAWPRWRPEAPVEVWLHRIAINVARSYRRRSLWRHLPLLSDRLAGRPQPLDETFVVMRALRQMPIDDASALLLRYYHGFSGEEIAAGLGIPASTVRGRIVRARSKLRQLLSDWNEDGSSNLDLAELRRLS